MTHLLRITDNTTTVTLSSGNMYIANFTPKTARRTDEPLSESAQIGFTGGTSTIRTNIQAINRLFEQAENYTRYKTGKRVYVEFDPDTSGDPYRAQIAYAEQVALPDDVLGDGWASTSFEATITWYRVPFWERSTLTQIPLANSSSTSTTDNLTVNNRNDGSGENWANIAAADVIGDLPAPIHVQMLNATTDADATDEIYIFHNINSTPFSFVHTIEGESSTNASSTTDANSSAGAYGTFTWAVTTETKIAEWPIASSDLDDMAGGRFAIVTRWPAVFPYTDCYLRWRLETAANYSELAAGDLELVAPTTDTSNQRELNYFEPLRIDPVLENNTSILGVVLSLYALRSSTDNSIDMDYLQLSPISRSSGWRYFKSIDQGVGIDETFVHDDVSGFTYKLDSSGLKSPEFTSYGGPILLKPNTDQRLYFNTCTTAGAAEVSQSWGVKLWYRPRRSSL